MAIALTKKYSLKFNGEVVDVCFRIHNFIVQHRDEELVIDRCDQDVIIDDCHHFYAVDPEITEGICGGESHAHQGGHPKRLENHSSLLRKE